MVGNIAILGKAGDTKITWNNENDLEVSRARKEFERLKGLGYKAYKVLDKAGVKRGDEIQEFDPSMERIVMVGAFVGG
jgi:hypothetical protein